MAGGRLTAGKAAQTIVFDGRAHGLYVRERGLDWNEINGLAKEYKQREANHNRTHAERHAYQDLIRYRAANQQSAHAWERVYTEQGLQKVEQKQPHKIYQANNEKKINIAKAFSQQRDELAFKIQENIAVYEPFLDELKINRQRLEKSAARYQAFQEQQPQQEQSTFQVKDSMIYLAASTLENLKQYMEVRQTIRSRVHPPGSPERKHLEISQYEFAQALRKESTLWEAINTYAPERMPSVDVKQIENEIAQNRFSPKTLKPLDWDTTREIQDYEEQIKTAEFKKIEHTLPVTFKIVDNRIVLPEFFLEKLNQYFEVEKSIGDTLKWKDEGAAKHARDVGYANKLRLAQDLTKEQHLWDKCEEMAQGLYKFPEFTQIKEQLAQNRLEPMSLKRIYLRLDEQITEAQEKTQFRNQYLPEKATETQEQQESSFKLKENGQIVLTAALREKITVYLVGEDSIRAKQKEAQAARDEHYKSLSKELKADKEAHQTLAKTLLQEKELWAEAEKITKKVVIVDPLKSTELVAQLKNTAGIDAKLIQQLHQDLRGHEYREHQAIHEKLSWSHSMGRGMAY